MYILYCNEFGEIKKSSLEGIKGSRNLLEFVVVIIKRDGRFKHEKSISALLVNVCNILIDHFIDSCHSNEL